MTDPIKLPPRSYVRAALRMAALLTLPFIFVAPVMLLWMLKLSHAQAKLVRLFYVCARRICGVRLKVEGTISPKRPLMLVSNHSSYLDIFILGSLLPVSFTPKKEIRSWPVVGGLAVLADSVFVERKPADLQRARAEMAEKLEAKKTIVLFPEGTTGDGIHVKPFKSGFLSLIESHDLPLQPVTLSYTHIGEMPLSAATRELVSWVGEATLVDHILCLFSFPYTQVHVQFHAVERIDDHEDRKALAKACETTIASSLKQTLEANGVFS